MCVCVWGGGGGVDSQSPLHIVRPVVVHEDCLHYQYFYISKNCHKLTSN